MRFNHKYFLFMILFLTLFLSACSKQTEQNPEGIVIEDIYVKMTDGVKLATRVYRPDDDHQYPVLLARTPYNSGAFGSKKEGDYRDVALKMAEKGYEKKALIF